MLPHRLLYAHRQLFLSYPSQHHADVEMLHHHRNIMLMNIFLLSLHPLSPITHA
jgi:hypothetical protein